MAEQGYKIGPVLADRIISTIRRVESDPYRTGFTRIETRFEEGQSLFTTSGLRIGTFTGSWSKGTTHTVALLGATATTHSVTNIFANISVDCGSRKCAIAKDGTAWYLIQAEC